MDDFPAGPASPGPRRPRLTVVIPVFNGGDDLVRCLRRLRETSGPEYELIVVDDGSTDDSAAVAASFGARVLRHERPLGPAAARNAGALEATAPIVFFLDADVAVHEDTLRRALRRFDARLDLAALFGSYDDSPAALGVVSRYRNLLHHFVHQSGTFVADDRPVRTFWTGLGAIRKDIFLAHGGFDPERYRRPAIEDIELGYRVSRSGGRIVLARDVQASHLKRWSFVNMVRTDIFCRGVPWMLLILRSGVGETDLNVDRAGRLSVAATGLLGLALLGSPVWPPLLLVAIALLGVVVATNRAFYRFLAGRGGWLFAAASVPLQRVFFACCGASVIFARAIWHGRIGKAGAELAAERARAQGRELRLDEAGPGSVPPPVSPRSRRSVRWPR